MLSTQELRGARARPPEGGPDRAARAVRAEADGAVMAGAAGILFVSGALIGAVSLALPHARAANDGGLLVNVVLAFLGGVALMALGRRVPRWSFQATLAVGTLLVTRAVYLSADPGSFYAVWYVWVGLFAAYFFTRPQLAVHLALVGLAYGLVLAHRPGDTAVGRWLTMVMTLLVAAALLDTLVRRVRREAASAARSTQNLTAVVQATRELSTRAEPRRARAAICEAALEVAAADSASLWEPAAESTGLAASATAGGEISTRPLLFVARPTGATRAFASREPLFVADLAGNPAMAPDGVAPDALSGYWQPVIREQTSVGVLAIYWNRPVPQLPADLRAVVELLAAEAGAAMERADLLSRLEAVARTDDLTGLPNRRAWEERMPIELARARRDAEPICVAMLDLDNFKAFNDERGHQAGDRLLKQTAASWSNSLRMIDLLARYGGEEFALALPHCTADSAVALLERLQNVRPEDQTFSAGVACWRGDETADELLGRADAALYEAKRAGRDRILSADGPFSSDPARSSQEKR